MTPDTARYLDAFVDEARELVQALNDALLSFEDDPSQLDTIDEMFRAAHTLKGMAAAMGFGDIAGLTHRMETVLALLRQGKLQSSPDLFDALFRSLDALQEMVEMRSANQASELDTYDLVWLLETLASNAEAAAAAQPATEASSAATPQAASPEPLLKSRGAGHHIYRVTISLSADCRMPNVRAFMVLNHIQPLGEVLGTNPGGRALLEEDYGLSFELVLASGAEPGEVERAVSAVMEIEGVSVEQIEPDETQGPDATATLHLTARQVAGSGTGRNARQTFSVRVGTDRLDRALIVASELAVLHRYLIAGRTGAQQADLEVDLARAAAMADELQDILTEARLVPVEDVFRRFPRMVRDLARQRGRKVRLDISGAETVLDRVMIDDLGDALVHLLRNAIDHGIESPAARQAAGKPEQGVVTLAAYHDGEDVVVEVRDDGAGIDANVVRRSAIEQGIMSAQDAAELNDEEVLDLAFVPGLTTSPTVTELSGRGFGMDIVRAKLAQLDGTVHIESQRGQGTVTTLRVPKRLTSALPRSMRH